MPNPARSAPSIREQATRIATELGFEHKDYIAARKKWSEYRDVMKGLGGSS